MLSYQAIWLPHFGQLERGRSTDSCGSFIQERMQTLRKLPMSRPKTPATT